MKRARTCFRRASSLIGTLCAVAIVAESPQAQTYPSRPIEFVSPTSPGAGTDLFMRAISGMLEKEKIFPQPILNANRVGGAGMVAYNYIKSKRGDPHVILTTGTGAILNASVRPELDIPLSTFTPLVMFAQDPQVIAVRAESKFKTFKDLVEAGKREPNTISAGITGPTGNARLALHLVERESGAKFKYVSFKGGGEAVLATLGGHVEITGENMSEMLQLYESKKMRVLAVTGERRFTQAPEIPTLKELGYNIVAATGRGFSMPGAVPKEAAATMEAALKRVYDSQAYKEYSERNMFENKYLDSAAFAKYLAEHRVVQEEFLRALGVVK
jgi:tripartite-type tricarboxylate transporter receptor subunit TctC